jgi:hypothetical protein
MNCGCAAKRLVLAVSFAFAFTLSGSSEVDASVEIERCASKLASLTDSTLMSRTTAHRRARSICRNIRTKDPSFWKALRVLRPPSYTDDPINDMPVL